MINAVSAAGNFTGITGASNPTSALQTATLSSSVSAFNAVSTRGGFTEEGLAFLALLALQNPDDTPLNLAQRLILLALLYKISASGEDSLAIHSFNSLNSFEVQQTAMPTTGYNAYGGAVPQLQTGGGLFNAMV